MEPLLEEEEGSKKPDVLLPTTVGLTKSVEVKSETDSKQKEIDHTPTSFKERSRTDPDTLSMPSRQSGKSFGPQQFLSLDESNINVKLEYLKDQLNNMVSLSKNLVEKGLENIDIQELLKSCDEARRRVEEYFNSQEPKRELDERTKSKLEHLRCHLREVIEVTREFRDESFLSPSVENFVRTCEAVENKLHIYSKNINSKPITETTKQRLEELKSHIRGVVQLTKEYEKEGLLTSSVESFLHSCTVAENKIDSYATNDTEDLDNKKLEHLKGHIIDLEDIALDVKQEGIVSPSLEKFLISCKDFKDKLEQYNNRNKKSSTEETLTKLVNEINETIELSKQAKEDGFMSESVEEFIKSCEGIKKVVESTKENETVSKENKILGELKTNIDDVMKLISQCRNDGLITSSVAEFLKSCDDTKSKIEVYERYPLENYEGIMIYPKCSEACICGERDSLTSEPCDRCEEIMEKVETDDDKALPPPPCDFCAGIIKEPESEESICDTCSGKPPVELPEWPAYVSPEQSQELVCTFCKKPHPVEESEISKEKEHEDEKQEENPSQIDSSLGYFEKKVRKITRIKRSQNRDGTIREEKETIVIRKEKHDPNETSIADDDDDEFGDVSYESMTEDGKNVRLFIAPEQNQRGFLNVRKVQSTIVQKKLMMFDPILIHSISLDTVSVKIKGDEVGCSKGANDLVNIFDSSKHL